MPTESLSDTISDRLGWQRVFSVVDVAEHERHACWCDTAGIASRFETIPEEPFAATLARLDLGTIGISQARFTAQTWTRSGQGIARDDCDDLVVNVRHRGGAVGDMAGRNVVAPAGSVVMVDLAQTQRHRSDASDTSGFVLPRAVAEQLLPTSVRRLHGHVVAPDHAALLVSHLAALRQSAHHLPASSGPALAQTVLDLFAIGVAASLGSVTSDAARRDRGLRVALCDAIDRHLGSPSLNTARLSRMLGVSRSTLYRLLQDEGGVQAYIRNRRLARVAAQLRIEAERATIATLAERWGFCDAAYLGRAFREVYGMTPGDYRALHGG
ncbi:MULTISPECIES: helix-turn-helix domain-containing protein [unclassified Sphingomonas]|uniref:helix-turn-helix domain-containing protein n=1 Tax=unclassified Sphingomonas TaxID=196159 RepID=UPI00044C312B|nr:MULTISPECIES: helix-turn-helix domain-containing protein [unclassified Sphingomonas]EZP52601.1 Transcriptional regulator, AraC family protein [Sphingomonas sp. RIT328]